MNFEEAFGRLRKGEEIFNGDWDGLKEGKIMYLTLQVPDEISLNTEPYIILHIGTHHVVGSPDNSAGWEFKRFPWTPSCFDLMSGEWNAREKVVFR